MQSSEARRSRKALAALVGFVARAPAECQAVELASRTGQLCLLRENGTERKTTIRIFRVALAQGLILAEKQADGLLSCSATTEGRSALKRWLADPDSAFQDQHRTLTTRPDPDHGHVSVNLAESPLAALARIKGRGGDLFLEPCQVEAGERLRSDFTRGQMQPSLGQSSEPVRAGRQPGSAGGAAVAARGRVDAALAQVGPELSGVLVDVCCFLKGLSEVERERQWPARSAKLMLRTALAALARHYAVPRRNSIRQPAPPPHAP